jgi:hypothetical protein
MIRHIPAGGSRPLTSELRVLGARDTWSRTYTSLKEMSRANSFARSERTREDDVF